MKRKQYPLIEGLEITALAAEGKAMGRHNGVVVFVPLTVPGDVVDVQIRSKRRRFMEGFVTRYITKSPLRAEPFCQHFGVCGGCKWQNLPYDEQLRQKHAQVVDQLTRIGKIELPSVEDTLPSEKTTFYRNKLEFTFAPRRWMTREEVASGAVLQEPEALGFHIPGMFDKVLQIDKCWLQADPSNALRNEVRAFCVEHQMPFYDARTHEGLMRNMIVRTAGTGEVMVIVVFGHEDERNDLLLSHLRDTHPEITSLLYIINEKLNDSIGDQTLRLHSGRDHIFEEMDDRGCLNFPAEAIAPRFLMPFHARTKEQWGSIVTRGGWEMEQKEQARARTGKFKQPLRFKIGGKSFYQTNSEQAHNLYKVARGMAALKPTDVVYDLYTGTGTIANFVARDCAKVVGVEYVHEAIDDARENSRLNGIDNTVFFAGDMKDVLSDEFIEKQGHPDVVILDPPRAGVHEDVLRVLLRAAPERIVYVSCNPASQARDLALLDPAYKVEAVQPVDMFPHTHHVENVVKLVKR